jgi:hypothetical protein
VFYAVYGSAGGNDFRPLSGRVLMMASRLDAKIVVRPRDDFIHEDPEVVGIQLTPNAAYQLGSPSTAEVTIVDND